MNAITRRLAAVAALTAAPALIALGAATASQAQTTVTNTGPRAGEAEILAGRRRPGEVHARRKRGGPGGTWNSPCE